MRVVQGWPALHAIGRCKMRPSCCAGDQPLRERQNELAPGSGTAAGGGGGNGVVPYRPQKLVRVDARAQSIEGFLNNQFTQTQAAALAGERVFVSREVVGSGELWHMHSWFDEETWEARGGGVGATVCAKHSLFTSCTAHC